MSGLVYYPVQPLRERFKFCTKINKTELRTDFAEVHRRMRTKWYFRNKPTKEFSNTPKSIWMSPIRHPNLEVYFSKLENKVFKITQRELEYSDLRKLGCEAIRFFTGDRSTVIKNAD